jgi:hypothetical protein
MDVLQLLPEVMYPADDIVKVALLPEGARSASAASDFEACLAFQVAHDLNDGLCPGREQQVDVLGHNHVAEKEKAGWGALRGKNVKKEIALRW